MKEIKQGYYGVVDLGPYPISGLEKDAPINSTFELADPMTGDILIFTIESETRASSGGLEIALDKIKGMWHHKGIWAQKNPRSLVEMLCADVEFSEQPSLYWSERFYENQEKRNYGTKINSNH